MPLPQLRRFTPRGPVDNRVDASFGEGALGADGVASVSWTGASNRAAALSVAGLATVLWVSSPAGVLSSAGVGAASWTGIATASSAHSGTGTGAASFVGGSIAESVLTIGGVGAFVASSDGSGALTPPAVFGDLTTLFVGYCADLRTANPTRPDTTTLVAHDLPTVRSASPDGVDDANTMYDSYLSST